MLSPPPNSLQCPLLLISSHASLRTQRVSAVYDQQCAEVQDPSLPPDSASQLVGHMLALQAEGLPHAQVGV